jgi:hypothetical protein
MTADRQLADYMADVYQQCDHALIAALYRPLTNDEITALRYAAGVRPQLLVTPVQPDIWEILPTGEINGWNQLKPA